MEEILGSERLEVLKAKLKDIASAPPLRRLNGFGCSLVGTLSDEALKPLCLKMYWLTALWIPIIPLCVYLVDTPLGGSFRFYKKLSLSDFHSIYRKRLWTFYLTVIAESLLTIFIVAAAVLLVTLLFSAFRR